MTTRRDLFGRGCLWISLAALYTLCGMKLFVALRDGVWLYWPLGDYLPDAVVRAVFALPEGGVRRMLTWLMRQDVMYHAAAVSLLLWLLTLSGSGGKDDGSDSSGDAPPPERVKEV